MKFLIVVGKSPKGLERWRSPTCACRSSRGLGKWRNSIVFSKNLRGLGIQRSSRGLNR